MERSIKSLAVYEQIASAYGDNWQANAKLIGTAPDMLAELKACEELLLGAIVHAPRIRDLLTERLASVRSVIAKAGG